MKQNTPRETLAALAQKGGRSASKNKEARGQRTPVGPDSKCRKECGPKLNFVKHHQPLQRFQRQHGVTEPCDVSRVLEIKELDRSLCAFGERASQCGFADLASPQQRDDWHFLKPLRQRIEVVGSPKHGLTVP